MDKKAPWSHRFESDRNFITLAKEHFKFLVDDYGFKATGKISESVLYLVNYKNLEKEVGISVYLDRRDQKIYVELHHLVNDEMMRSDANGIRHMCYLEVIVDICESTIGCVRFPRKTLYDDDSLNDEFTKQIANLKKYASEILVGDFTVFQRVGEILNLQYYKQ